MPDAESLPAGSVLGALSSPGGVPSPGSLPAPGTLQIWWASVEVGDLSERLRGELAADLDEVTLARLGRFLQVADRDRGLAAHALLRRLLAAVVGGPPSRLVLRTRCAACGASGHGKPFLDLGGQSPVEFNLTHSGDIVCVALGPAGTQVGVDVEQRRPRDWSRLRRSVFADQEWARMQEAADPDLECTRLWTRKEASVKASGHGLALPFHQVFVTAAESARGPAADPAGLAYLAGPAGPVGWSAELPGDAGSAAGHDLSLRPDAPAAVAIHAPRSPAPALRPPAVHRVTLTRG